MLNFILRRFGYGLLIPFFFIRTGMTFDLDGLLGSPASLAELPLFLALFLVVRGLPAPSLTERTMPDATQPDFFAWWATVTAEFAFLLALPFVVAVLALARQWWSQRHDD